MPRVLYTGAMLRYPLMISLARAATNSNPATLLLNPNRPRGPFMLRWFQALMPREDRFFVLYNRHAQTLVKGAEALCELLQGGPGVAEAARKLAVHEDEADAIARSLLVLARRTFITPFDRGDLKDLMNSLDDTIDQMK